MWFRLLTAIFVSFPPSQHKESTGDSLFTELQNAFQGRVRWCTGIFLTAINFHMHTVRQICCLPHQSGFWESCLWTRSVCLIIVFLCIVCGSASEREERIDRKTIWKMSTRKSRKGKELYYKMKAHSCSSYFFQRTAWELLSLIHMW